MPASPPEITVLLPAYDCADVLGEALDCLLAQTQHRWETLILDDGSQDGTAAVARAYARRDPRFRYVPLPHRGIPATLNAGLELARAPLIARMDADDRCAPERFAAQIRALERLGGDAVIATRIRSFKSSGEAPGWGMQRYVNWVNAVVTPQDHFRDRYVESPVAHSSILAPRALFAGGYRDLAFAEDYDLWLRLLQRGVPFTKPDAVLTDIRDDGGRISRNDDRYSQAALRHCKQDHLIHENGPLADGRPVLFWGAGRVGKPWLRELRALGVPAQAVVDLHPRKLGKVIHATPVIPPTDLPRWWRRLEHPLLLVGVGAPGAREDMRRRLAELFRAHPLRELDDYLFVA